jgi:hypothetical protein
MACRNSRVFNESSKADKTSIDYQSAVSLLTEKLNDENFFAFINMQIKNELCIIKSFAMPFLRAHSGRPCNVGRVQPEDIGNENVSTHR